MPDARKVLAITTALVAAVFAVCAAAQESASPPAETPPLTEAAVQASLDQVQADPTVDSDTKQAIVDTYTKALEQVRQAQLWRAKFDELEQEAQNAPQELERLQQAIAEETAPVEPEIPDGATLADLEQRLKDRQAELAQAQGALNDLKARLAKRPERRKEVPELVAAARERLVALPAAPVSAPGDETPLRTEADRIHALALRQATQAEIAALEKELQTYETRGQLLDLRQNDALRNVARLEQIVNEWQRIVEGRRQAEVAATTRKLDETLERFGEKDSPVRRYVESVRDENIKFVDKRLELVENMRGVTAQAKYIEQELARVRDARVQLESRIDAAGLDSGIALLMRRRQAELPDTQEHERTARARKQEIARVGIEQIELQEERLALADVPALVQAELIHAQNDLRPTPEQRALLEEVLPELLETRSEAINALDDEYDRYFTQLVDLGVLERQLIRETNELAGYINEHILWVRSGYSVGRADVQLALNSATGLVEAERWSDTAAALWRDLVAFPALNGLVLAAVTLLLWLRSRVAERLAASSERAAKSTATSIWPTFLAFTLTLILSLPLPLLLRYFGWRLSASLIENPFVGAVGRGLMGAATLLVALSVLRQMLRPQGLALGHFDWPSAPARAIRRHLLWLEWTLVPAVFLLSLLGSLGEDLWLGRFVFMASLVALAVFAHYMLRPQNGHIPVLRNYERVGGRSRLRNIYYALGLLVPVALIAMAWFGYYYTSLVLTKRVFMTFCLFLGLLIVRETIMRWVMLARRRLAIDQARKRREAPKSGEAGDGEPEVAQEEDRADLARIDAQTSRIIRTFLMTVLLLGVWWIWSEVLPALRVLNQVRFSDAEGAVTLGNVVIAAIIGVITFVAATNIPGVLEFSLLRRMSVRPGERYAITTITRYAIVGVGVVFAFRAIGVDWSSVQWLVAALGVGLGFGLQEIFANFISGLIILFERPIRVGDTVTIGGISGTVSRIRIRATWITDFDRKELVVPNKEFVTTQLVNWTLSDNVLRIIVPVGIAYGSDTALAERLLHEVARNHPRVQDDPPPQVLFVGFGDNALNFELRCFCTPVEVCLQVRHELHVAVDNAFRQAGIEIAFPQRDIHIRSIDAALPVEQKPEESPEHP